MMPSLQQQTAYAQLKSHLAEGKIRAIQHREQTQEQMVAVELTMKGAEAQEANTKTTSFLIKELHQVSKENPEFSDEKL